VRVRKRPDRGGHVAAGGRGQEENQHKEQSHKAYDGPSVCADADQCSCGLNLHVADDEGQAITPPVVERAR
jgi:hypothetical protein